MQTNITVPIITLLLGGGLASAILNLVRARTESKKAPVDRDAIVVTSAETAVTIMQKVLDATNAQLNIKEKEVDELSQKLQIVKQELRQLKERCGELEELLGKFMVDHPNMPKSD